MFWKIKEKKRVHKTTLGPGSQRVIKRFAWWPVRLSDPPEHKVWLESYYVTQERAEDFYSGYIHYYWFDLFSSRFHPNDWVNIIKNSQPRSQSPGWIGFDLDGTLAHHVRGNRDMMFIGTPISKTVDMVKRFLERGWEVKIVTARATNATEQQRQLMANWCQKHIGRVLPIVSCKDEKMMVLFDDRACSVESNTGKILQFTK